MEEFNVDGFEFVIDPNAPKEETGIAIHKVPEEELEKTMEFKPINDEEMNSDTQVINIGDQNE